jgi:hypothetical protein
MESSPSKDFYRAEMQMPRRNIEEMHMFFGQESP